MATSNADHQCLFGKASSQQGHFTTRQAEECGIGRDTLSYFVGTGRFIRIHHGVYRLRDFPSSPHEEVMAAWLAIGGDKAVVSHESALDIHELSDIIPRAIHLTIPRSRRYKRGLPGVQLHTAVHTMQDEDVVRREGMRVASPARAIVDTAAAFAGPDQIELAVKQALDRGMTTPRRLRAVARTHSRYVKSLIERSIDLARP
jgi:predicted transcriptional regulator of viral defense system